MEDIGNIKSFRGNLMIISVLNLLILLFFKNISEINILGFIKINDMNSIKFLLVLFFVNIYAILRYYQYFIKFDIKFDSKLIFKIIVRNYQHLIIKKTYNGKNVKKIDLDIFSNLLINDKITPFKKILSSNDISNTINRKKDNYTLNLSINPKKIENENILLEIKDSPKEFIIIFLEFITKEKYISDYYLPFILGYLSSTLIFFKVYLLIAI